MAAMSEGGFDTGSVLRLKVVFDSKNTFRVSLLKSMTVLMIPFFGSAPDCFGQVYVSDLSGKIGVYSESGQAVNADLVTGLRLPTGISISGSNIYIANYLSGTVGVYTTSGTLVNAALLSGLSGPIGIAVSGSNLFVSSIITGKVGVYTTSGVAVNENLITGLQSPYSVAVSGSSLYVSDLSRGTIGEYTTSGVPVNTSLLSGLNSPLGMAIAGSNIYVTSLSGGTVGVYTTGGAIVNASLVTGLAGPSGLAVTNSNIYVANYFGRSVGLYTLDGVAVNANWITGFGAPWGIAVPMSAVTTGTSVDLSGINVSQYPIFAGGTLLLNSGDISSQAFSVQSEGGTITSPSAGSATLSGVFSGAGGLMFNGAGTTILTGANTYSGGTIVSSGVLQGDTTSLQGSITNNSTVVFDQASAGTYAGVMSGTGALTKQGTGVLVLTGANNYSGGTTISSGSLQGDTTSLQGAITNNSTVVFDQPNAGTYAGVMSGTGALTKQGTGVLVLTGANTYSGGTTISSGSLQGDTTSLQGSITNNGRVVFDQPNAGTYAGVMSGTGDLTKQGAGVLMLTGANTYSGGTSVLQGVLQGDATSLQGSITNNGTVVFDQASNGTFTGVMSGTGGLTKQGTGALVLTGANTYSGGTTITGGTVSIAGTSPTGTGDIVVSTAATLMGTGTISGNVLVSGRFKPGNSPGYIAISKNLTLDSGSVYQQDIAGSTQSSSTSPVGAAGYFAYLRLDGQLLINPGATLVPKLQNLFDATEAGYGSAVYTPALGNLFRIATATGGISGTFSGITQPDGLATGTQFLPFYNYGGSNSLDLAVTPSSYATTLANTSSNTQSVAAVLDKLSTAQLAGTANSQQTSLMYATATQSASFLAGFAQGLSGEIYADTVAVISQSSQRVQSAVLARNSDSAVPIPSVNSVWGAIAYQYGNRSSDSNASGFRSKLYQAVFGSDLYRENDVKAGAGFSLSNTRVSMNADSATVDQGSIFVYGNMPVMQDYVLDGMASVGLSSSNVTRADASAANSLKAQGIKGNDVLLSAGISRPFDSDDVAVTPYIRASWQMLKQSSFDEGESSVAALSVNAYSGNGTRGVIGLALGSKSKDSMAEQSTYRVNVAVGADTNTLINPSLSASLASYGTVIQTANVGNMFLQADFYGTVKLRDSAFAFAGITGEVRSGQNLGSLNVGVKLQF